METHVKERLTGAVILVALVVLLVPELLTGSPGGTARSVAARSEAPREDAQRSLVIDLAQGSAHADPAAAPDLSAKALSGSVVSRPDATLEPARVAAAQGDAQPRPAAPSINAAATIERLADPRPVQATAPDGDKTASAADTDAQSLSAMPVEAAAAASAPTGERAKQAAVNKAPSRTVAPAAKPPSSKKVASSASGAGRSGFAVQLGSFASRGNAERLVRQLKGKGFTGYVLGGGGSSGKLYRVRVGSPADRGAADTLASKLHSAGFKGAVVSKP